MHKFASLLIFCFAIFAALPVSQAARNLETPASTSTKFQLVVLEADGCIYCNVFRRQLLPAYEASLHGKKAPIRFIDINDPSLGKLGLTQPVGVVPTFVVLENNEEIGRIPGLVGRHDFFRALDYIFAGR
jgi:thioredoxin-related protein